MTRQHNTIKNLVWLNKSVSAKVQAQDYLRALLLRVKLESVISTSANRMKVNFRPLYLAVIWASF